MNLCLFGHPNGKLCTQGQTEEETDDPHRAA